MAGAPDKKVPDVTERNRVTGIIADAAYKVHEALGPGLLKNVYEKCLVHELSKRRVDIKQ